MDSHQPPGTIPGDRSTISYFSPGDEAAFKVSSTPDGPYHPLLDGPLLEAYEVDFYPILPDAGLLDVDFVRTVSPELSSKGKAELKKRVETDVRNEALMGELDGSLFQKKALLKGIHFDSLVATDFKLPFAADSRVGPMVEFKNRQFAGEQLSLQLNSTTLASLIPSAFPDFGELDWSSVLKLRNTEAVRDLRVLIERMCRKLTQSIDAAENLENLNAMVRGLFIEELVEKIREIAPDVGTMTFGLLLNLIPYAGFAGSAAELGNILELRNSWVSLMR